MSSELGLFLADRRRRLQPSDVGLVSLGRRRAVGLRREEVAALAGVGATWYTMLESGRATNPSEDVLRAVARALRLSATEIDYLLRLARASESLVSATVTPEVLTILQAMSLPAYIVDRRWRALAWNDAFASLWEVKDAEPPLDVIRLMLIDERARMHHGANLERNAVATVAMIRSGRGRWPNDERFRELSDLLSRDSVLAQAWERYTVADPLETTRVVFALPIGETTGYLACNADLPLSGLTMVFQVTERATRR